MEQRAQYGPWQERPRLVVVHDGAATYSALPHAVLFSDLSDAEIRVYAAVQSFAWGDGSECTASHETIAGKIGKESRTVRRLLKGLVEKGYLGERRTGRGQSKAYRIVSDPSGQNWPVDTAKRPKMASQQAKNGQFKRPKMAAPIEEDSGKKKQEEELQPTAVDGAAAPTPAAATDQAAILRGLTDEAREILDWHRRCHGRRQPAKLNPESARVLEAAVADLGVPRLRESVQYMAGKIPPVPELSKAISAAKTKRQKDEGSNGTPRNGAASPAPASKQSSWAGFKGRYGGNVVTRPEGRSDDR
jgi:hypothetical protein